jgi:hypothetical protein
MDVKEAVQQIKTILEENELNVDKSLKAQHWLYRSSSYRMLGFLDDDSIMFLKFASKRELSRLCDDLSSIKETIGNLEKMVVNELNYREFGTAEHTREWW